MWGSGRLRFWNRSADESDRQYLLVHIRDDGRVTLPTSSTTLLAVPALSAT